MKQRAAHTALSLLVCTPALVWTASLLAATPPIILVAATGPAALLGGLILLAQHGAQRPRRALALALLWGATGAAFLSSNGNELAQAWMNMLNVDDARTATALLVAPVLEEGAKALGLVLVVVLVPASFRSTRDGIVYGALIGVGFVWTENFLYLGVSMLQGGQEGLVRSLFLRGIVTGATHAVFTACSGAALGWWAADSRRGATARAVAAGGLLWAIVQHIAWNALAAPMIVSALCGASTSGGACIEHPSTASLLGVTTLIAVGFLTPGIAFAAVAWRSTTKRVSER